MLDAGIRDIALGIGGSATTDGGAGLLRALGADDRATTSRRWTWPAWTPGWREVRLRIACDVTNPLLGPDGAAAVYGPQKGATPELVAALDARLARFADALEAATGRHERDTPGRRAPRAAWASGCCASRARFASLRLEPGIDLVMAEAGFDAALATADLVITGEGRIDRQTAFGKTAMGVARRAQAAGVACVAVGGGVTPEGIEALAAVGAVGGAGERGAGHGGGRDGRRRRAAGALRRAGRAAGGRVGLDLVHRLVIIVPWTDASTSTRRRRTSRACVERAQHGERITIARGGSAGRDADRRSSRRPRPRRPIGMDRGRIVIHDDFDDPLPEFDGVRGR